MTHTTRDSKLNAVTPCASMRLRRSAAVIGLGAAAIVAGTLGLTMSYSATEATPPMARADGAPVVVELFTSQSCYSCPPAEAKLADFALRDGIVALEHHVDYWDSLVYGSAGRWKDVFSSAEATARQRAYNAVVRGRGHSYTPQMVIDGRYEAVGNRDSEVRAAIRDARGSDAPRLSVRATAAGKDGVRVSVSGAASDGEPAGIWLVGFLREHTTEVKRGENQGKTLAGRNVVREMQRIGEWRGDDVVIDLESARPDEGHGCAILVQSNLPGPILGAAYCNLDRTSNS